MIKKFLEEEYIRFLIAGAVPFTIEYALLYFLTEIYGLYYLVSSFIAFSVSVLINYLMCAYWVFANDAPRTRKQILLFVGTTLVGLAINQLLMWLLVSILEIYFMIAKLFSTVVVLIWNYVTKKKVLS